MQIKNMKALQLETDMNTTLIKTLSAYGVKIQTGDIPKILSLGIDTFLLKRGEQIPDKNLDEVYLILHEMRE